MKAAEMLSRKPQTSKSSLRNSRRAFSLIELLVVAGVTLALTGVIIVAYGRGSRRQTALFIEGAKIAQLILRAKSLAITTYNIPPIPCGYGLWVSRLTREYHLIVFNVPADDPRCVNIRTQSLDTASIQTFKSVSGVEERYSLDPNLIFPGGSDWLSYVIFVPPDPKTYVYVSPAGGLPIASSSGKIYLWTSDFKGKFTIAVSTVGQITFPPP